MRPVLIPVIVMLFYGCRVYRKIPENGIAYAERYNFVFREVLDIEDHFVNGRLTRSLSYHANGTVAIDMRSSGSNPDSVRTDYYYANGQKMRETPLVSDTLILENDWYENGMQRLSFVLGANKYQLVRRWHANGIKSEESEWLGNIRNGKLIEWEVSGRRTRNESYHHGVKIK